MRTFSIGAALAPHVNGVLIVVLATCVSLFVPGRADASWTPPTGMKGWATVVGPGPAIEYFATPDEACRRQKAAYAPKPGSIYLGWRNTAFYNHIKQCMWIPTFGDSGPSTVDLQCHTGYVRTADGQCRNDPFVCEGPCPANGGGSPVARTGRPIEIMTGAKQLVFTDFEDAAGHLSLTRVYSSKRYGDAPTPFKSMPIGLANWQFDFQYELQIAIEWTSVRRIAVATPDGRAMAFRRETTGAMSVYMDAANPTPQTDYRLEFVGTWPSVLDNLANSQTTWKLTDADDTVWMLQTFLDPISGKYDIARPVSRTTREGLVWTFTYGSANELTEIEDSYGKAITFIWQTGSFSGGSFPMVITEAVLPGGYKLTYSYSDVAAATSPVSPDRLVKVELKTSANVLLDATSYLYEDPVVPLFVTGILDRDDVRRWSVDYDAYGRALESFGPGGAFSTQVSYGSLGTTFTRTTTNPLGKQTIYNFAQSAYSYSGRWVSAAGQASTHTPASTQSFTYGTNKLTASMTDEEGRVTTYARNTRGLPTQIVEAHGTASARTTTITWHTGFNVPSQIVQPGRTTDFYYDTAGRLTSRVETDTTTFTTPYATNGRTRTWAYTWSTTGQLLTVDGPLAGTGDTIIYAYDADGYLASVTNEVGQVTTITAIDWRGAPLTVEDPNGVETTLTYDPHGRPLTITVDPGADQSVYTLEYNAVGDITKLTLPEGGSLEYSYDDASRLTGIENDRGQTQTFVNNAAGQPTSVQVKNASAAVTRSATFAYDELGRLLESIGAGSQTTAFEYDKVSNLTEVTDARGKVYASTFDPLNRLITETNPDSQTNQLAYNGQDDLTLFEDGRSLDTTRKVDGFGRVIEEVSPDRGTITYWYDNRDNLTKTIDADGVETLFTYDDADRRLAASFTGASGEDVTYGYDSTAGGNRGVGRLTSVDDEPGSSAFIYDAQGRLLTDTKVIQGQSYAVGYAYDANGEIVTQTLPSGRTVSFARGDDGLVSGVTSKVTPGSSVETLASSVVWRPFGPLAGLTYGNGLALAYSHDQNDWMSGAEVADGGTTILDLTYGRNANGELTGVTDNAATGRGATYGYTDSGRLNLADGAWGDDTYSYDAAGNRSQMTRTVSSVTTTWTSTLPGASNRISNLKDAGAVITRQFTYRAGGAITRDEHIGGSTYDYGYNARGRMISATKDSGLVGEYGYDAFGRRVWRETHGTGAVHIHYIFDPDGRLLAEHDAGTGDVLREYVWLGDAPLAMFDYSGGSPATFFIHTGQIDEPLAVTDSTQAKVWDAVLEPFGQAVMFGAAAEALDLRLPGQWAQLETGGLFQNWMRDYDPTLGRYAQADPLGIEAGENLYGYAFASALVFTDPTGEIAPALGAVFGGGLEFAEQYFRNGRRLECINWWRVGGAAALGAVGGAAYQGLFRLTNSGLKASRASFRYGTALARYRKTHGITDRNIHVSHWLFDARGAVGRHLPDWFKNSPWNLNPTSAAVNRITNPWIRKPLSSPTWARVAGGATTGGVLGDIMDRDCTCP